MRFSETDSAAEAIGLHEISAPVAHITATHTSAQFGKLFQPQQQILLYSDKEWEEFTREWVHCQRKRYLKVVQLGGAHDEGIDIAGLTDADGLSGVWDLFQCKHYDDALSPSTASCEIAKVIWHSFTGSYRPPRFFYFVAPKDCGMKLKRLLLDHSRLRAYVVDNWAKQCEAKISERFAVKLDGEFLAYFEAFDFRIFTLKSTLEIIDEHRTTPFFVTRFGGGLGGRPRPEAAPKEVDENESRYVTELLLAYGERLKMEITALPALAAHPELNTHLNRQREFFYHAVANRERRRHRGMFPLGVDLSSASVHYLRGRNHLSVPILYAPRLLIRTT